MTVDLRPKTNALLARLFRVGVIVTLIQAGLWTVPLVVAPDIQIPGRTASMGIMFVAVPFLALAFLRATMRQVVAHEGGVEVDGELVPWGATTVPKVAFFSRWLGLSRPARVWFAASTQGGMRHIMVVADVAELEGMARLRAREGLSDLPARAAYR